jgi:hypothetical protein
MSHPCGVRAVQRAAAPLPPPERRPLWRRLSGAPPARAGFPLRGGRPAAFGAPTIREEAPWPEAAPQRAQRAPRARRLRSGASRLRRLWEAWASCTLGCCLGVVLFVTDALGLSARARCAYSQVVARAAAVRGRFAQRLASGTSLTRKLSAAALESLGRGVSKTEKVAGLLRRAMSAEGRLDTCGAIRCYQARARGARAAGGRGQPGLPGPDRRGARRTRRLPTTWSPTTRSRWWAWPSASPTGVRGPAARGRRGARPEPVTTAVTELPCRCRSLRAVHLQQRRAGALHGHAGGQSVGAGAPAARRGGAARARGGRRGAAHPSPP